MSRRVKKIPEWLRNKTPEFADADVITDDIACALLSQGRHEKGRLYFTTNYIVFSGGANHIVVKNTSATASVEAKTVIMKVEGDAGKKYVLVPNEPRQCDSISRAITRASSSSSSARRMSVMPQDEGVGDGVSEFGEPNDGDETNDEGEEETPSSYERAADSLRYTAQVEKKNFAPPAEVKTKLFGAFTIPNVSLNQVRDAVFGDTSTFMVLYHKKLGDAEPNAPKWTADSKGSGTRLFTCKTQTPFGTTPFLEHQRYAVHKNGDQGVMLTYQGSAQCPKASFGETFRVQTLVEMVPEGGRGVKVSFYGILKWEGSKPSLVGRVIEENVDKSLPKSFQAFRDVAVELCSKAKSVFRRSNGRVANTSFAESQKTPLRTSSPPPIPDPQPEEEPAKDPTPPYLMLASIVALLFVMYVWSSRSLARAQERLDGVMEVSPDYVFRSTMEKIASRRASLVRVKVLLGSSDGAGLAALPPAEKQDIYKRLHELKLVIKQPDLSRPPDAQHEEAPRQPNDPEAAHTPSPPPPSQGRQNNNKEDDTERCHAMLGSQANRHAAEVMELRKLITEQTERMVQEQNDTLFRLRLLAVITVITFCFTLRQLVAMVT